MFIYNLYKPLNVALGSNDDQTVFTGQPAGYEAKSVYFAFISANFFDKQYSVTWHQRRIAVNALV